MENPIPPVVLSGLTLILQRVAIKDSAANVGSDYLWTHSGTRPTEYVCFDISQCLHVH